MKLVVIDGQSGRTGALLVERVRAAVSIRIMQKECPFATNPSLNLGSNAPGVFL